MNPPRLLLSMVVLAAVATTALRAQLMDLSFDIGTRFRNDFVNTELYFRLSEGSSAHFDFRFDPKRPSAGDAYVRIRVTDPEAGLMFDERRALDQVGGPPRYVFAFTEQRLDGPADRRFYENLYLDLAIVPGGLDENGVFVPPEVQNDFLSELYVYGWSPMIQYVPPGHGGTFRFNDVATNVTFEFVPVPEPSTYGLAALAMLTVVAGWRRWRAARISG